MRAVLETSRGSLSNSFGCYNVGIEEYSNLINVYPNPTTESIRFSINSGGVKEVKLEIINTVGAVVKVHEGYSSGQVVAMDVSDLPSGIYFLKTSANGLKGSTKFFKL